MRNIIISVLGALAMFAFIMAMAIFPYFGLSVLFAVMIGLVLFMFFGFIHGAIDPNSPFKPDGRP